jgi:predicted Zn-ribbon and HTH transcriptional regulator
MNTKLQKLFELSNLLEKDKYEINQIFFLLPTDKQQNILDNFDVLASRLEQMHKENLIEQEILL